MTNSGGRYLAKSWTPMLTAGRHSDDGGSFVISDNGTEEADSEIRRICFGNNNLRVPTPSDIVVAGSRHDPEEERAHSRHWSPLVGPFRASSEPWTRWASLPTRRKKAAILQYFSFARLFRVVTVTTPDDKEPTKCCLSPKSKEQLGRP